MPAPSKATRFAMTEKRVRDIEKPESGRLRYHDTDMPGLVLRVSAGGKRWAFFKKVNGKVIELALGVWPAMTVEAARACVRTKIAPDPAKAQQEKRQEREVQTLKDAWQVLLDHPWRRDGKARLRESTMIGYKAAWGQLAPHLGNRAVTEIAGSDVERARGKMLEAHGAAQTRRALALLVLLLGGRMPLAANGRAVGKPHIEPRERFMDASELGAFLRGLNAEAPLWRVFWLCCLLAPLRRGNLARARWSELHLAEPALWTVAASEAKGRKVLAMPIAPPLARLLRDWRAKNPDEEYVFPCGLTAGPRKSDGPIASVQHAWDRALQYAEAVRLCDAIAAADGATGKARFVQFLSDLDRERMESWNVRGRTERGARTGTPLSRCLEAIRERAKELKIDIGRLAMRDLSPHDLRRTNASWAVQANASLQVVAASLGHADSRVTEAHYGHLNDHSVRHMLSDNAERLLQGQVVSIAEDAT